MCLVSLNMHTLCMSFAGLINPHDGEFSNKVLFWKYRGPPMQNVCNSPEIDANWDYLHLNKHPQLPHLDCRHKPLSFVDWGPQEKNC